MKKLVLSGLSLIALGASGQAFAGASWTNSGIGMSNLEAQFERIKHQEKFESSKHEQPLQWDRYDEQPLLSVKKLYRAGILKQQYFDADRVATILVGTNFYHLSGLDKRRVAKSVDAEFKYTDSGARTIRIKDGVTGELVGEYSPAGAFLD